MEQISWSINADIAARWPCFSASEQHTSVTHATMISSESQMFLSLISHIAQQVRFSCKNDVCHEKTNLKVFVIVIPKEGAPILLLV